MIYNSRVSEHRNTSLLQRHSCYVTVLRPYQTVLCYGYVTLLRPLLRSGNIRSWSNR